MNALALWVTVDSLGGYNHKDQTQIAIQHEPWNLCSQPMVPATRHPLCGVDLPLAFTAMGERCMAPAGLRHPVLGKRLIAVVSADCRTPRTAGGGGKTIRALMCN